MKRTRHNPEQIVNKLGEADALLAAGRSVAQVVQALGVGEATFDRRRNQYGGMKAEDAVAIRDPSGLKAKPQTFFRFPLSTISSYPVAVFHTRAVPS